MSPPPPATLSQDYGVYAVFEQKLFRVGKDDDRGIGVFVRASYSPPDRNLIDVYADAGVELIGLADRRPHDKFGVAGAYAHVSLRGRRSTATSSLFMDRRGPCARPKRY